MFKITGGLTLGLLLATPLPAAEKIIDEETTACLAREFLVAAPETTMQELRHICSSAAPQPQPESLIYQRMQREREAEGTPSILTPHRRNYLLPATYLDNPNEAPFSGIAPQGSSDASLDNIEAKFQISIKTALWNDLFVENASLFFGFTSTSFWQVYNKEVSSPFRETNYEPEVFWATPLKWGVPGSDATLLVLGLLHQSNGQTGQLSRSWNRLYADFIWETGDFVFSFKPWYRLPEEPKQYPGDSSGDDNPDIEDYLGHFEFSTVYDSGKHEFTAMFRNNFSTGGVETFQLEWTFPLFSHLRGYAQFFNGYGESLIDYNHRTRRIGVGFLLSDLL